ncbi:MAG: response regulator [Owenweeksia sp.]|nr:response regulator [Owenweeksia sp.]
MKKILLIDDNPIDLLVHEKVLHNAIGPVEVVQKRSAMEALDFLKQDGAIPDIILLDIKMPLMDGFEFLRHLRQELHEVPGGSRIFMVSSSIDPEDISRATKEDYVVKFLNKPLRQEDVRNHLV